MKTFAIACLVVVGLASTSRAATVWGAQGDGKPSVFYDPANGVIIVQPDGQLIGLYQITSASGIFIRNANVPPGGLGLDVDSATEKSWAAFPAAAFNPEFTLGNIAPPGLTLSFLRGDLTLSGSGGLGTPNHDFDLTYGTYNGSPSVVDARLTDYTGKHFKHQFLLFTGRVPITWSNLSAVAGSPIPAIAPTLNASGLFDWNSAGSTFGVYAWDVTATNGIGIGSDVGRLTITLLDVPEPGAICLVCAAAFAVLGIPWRRKQTGCQEPSS